MSAHQHPLAQPRQSVQPQTRQRPALYIPSSLPFRRRFKQMQAVGVHVHILARAGEYLDHVFVERKERRTNARQISPARQPIAVAE